MICRGVGLFRYWTLSNLPLFLLAAPMLAILTISGIQALQSPIVVSKKSKELEWDNFLLQRLAIPQLILAGLALTTFHVQIVNRISSGYPIWYLYLADNLAEAVLPSGIVKSNRFAKKLFDAAPRIGIMYAIVQAVLYAAFLPPA